MNGAARQEEVWPRQPPPGGRGATRCGWMSGVALPRPPTHLPFQASPHKQRRRSGWCNGRGQPLRAWSRMVRRRRWRTHLWHAADGARLLGFVLPNFGALLLKLWVRILDCFTEFPYWTVNFFGTIDSRWKEVPWLQTACFSVRIIFLFFLLK